MAAMNSRAALWRTVEGFVRAVILGLALYGGIDLARNALADDRAYLPIAASAQEVKTLEERVTALEDLLVHLSREGDELYFTGANLHVVNGMGQTLGPQNGLGNVIIGYNEVRSGEDAGEEVVNDRSGSHMLVVGTRNNYSSVGGIVAGAWNSTTAPWASVSGGMQNVASGDHASVGSGPSVDDQVQCEHNGARCHRREHPGELRVHLGQRLGQVRQLFLTVPDPLLK